MSRLLDNSEEYRSKLLGRNLFTPESEYDINNPSVVNAINMISNEIINPGNSFDFSNTVFGRFIGTQTPITIIGRNELLKQKAYDVKSIIRTKVVPTIRFNSNFSGFKDLLTINSQVDYSITKNNDSTPLEKFKNAISDFTSFSSSVNPIKNNSTYIDNFIWNNKLILDSTGSGQLFESSKNLSRNIYHPNYDGIDTQFAISNKKLLYENINSFNTIKSIYNLYSFDIPYKPYPVIDDNYEYSIKLLNIGNTTSYSGIKDPRYINDISEKRNESWGTNDLETKIKDQFGLIDYTKNIISQLGRKATMNRTLPIILDNEGNQHFNGSIYSQNTADNEYGYDKVKNVNGITDNKFEKSVLYNSMKPKVVGNGYSNVMFSIENLATTYSSQIYPEEQRGRYNGRFMWFNPYIVNINETSSPELTSTKFIGRSEPVYTFAGNERTLTVSFKMFTDYDENLLQIKDYNSYTNYIYSKNNINLNNLKNKSISDLKIEKELNNYLDTITKNSYPFIYTSGHINFEFPRDSYTLILDTNTYDEVKLLVNQITDYLIINSESQFLVTIEAFSSIGSDVNYSEVLAEQRADFIRYSVFLAEIVKINIDLWDKIKFKINYESNIDPIPTPINYESPAGVAGRMGYISSVELITPTKYNKELENTNLIALQKQQEELKNNVDNTILDISYTDIELNGRLNNNYNQLSKGSFSHIKNNIIAPGYISYSAKDMYDRLTFLNQCTRQGVSIDEQATISNSVFGKPPVLVVRIGDMYFTKAILSQLTIDFSDQNTWDLNINGFGVQFMSCDVNITLKLIGGSSLDGPTKNILNADNRSFYANSSLEDFKYDNKYVDIEQKILDKK